MIHGGGVWDTGHPEGWLDFSANLRPEGPPEWVMETLRSTLEDIRYYPDPSMRRARRGLAAFLGVPEDRILPTAGGTSAIDLVLTHFHGCVYTRKHAFAEYALRAEVHGRRHSLWDGNCGAGDTLILANPDNPSGRAETKESLLTLHERLLNAGAELIADEAFIDFCPEFTVRDHAGPGLTVVGSLTKILGVPGVRLGYLCAEPEVIRVLGKRALPWSLGTGNKRPAQGSLRRAAETAGGGRCAVPEQFPAGGFSPGHDGRRGSAEITGNPGAHLRFLRAGEQFPPSGSENENGKRAADQCIGGMAGCAVNA